VGSERFGPHRKSTCGSRHVQQSVPQAARSARKDLVGNFILLVGKMARVILSLFSLLYICLAFNPSSYPKSLSLIPDQYNLYWRINNSTGMIYLALEVKTLGWVGFGLGESTSGSMPGADIVSGMVSNGVAQIQDRHAVAKEYPNIDDCQNWILVSGEENSTWTIIEVARKLDTNDTQDRPFVGRNRIVFAWGTTDVFGYHGSKNT